jgi:hypothetical protein
VADSLSEALRLLVLNQGTSLHDALQRLAVEGLASASEIALFSALARSLVRSHLPLTSSGPEVYRKSLCAIFQGEQGVISLLDALPAGADDPDEGRLQAMERRFIGWRWRLRGRAERLRRVHGGLSFEGVRVLPQGEVMPLSTPEMPGDPALDVSAVTVGLLALGAREPLCWPEGYRLLSDAFWSTYLAESGDHELLDVAPPFLAWRALQAAAGLSGGARRGLFEFAEEVLAQSTFDPDGLRGMAR